MVDPAPPRLWALIALFVAALAYLLLGVLILVSPNGGQTWEHVALLAFPVLTVAPLVFLVLRGR